MKEIKNCNLLLFVCLAMVLTVMPSCHRNNKTQENNDLENQEPVGVNFDIAKMVQDYESYQTQGSQGDTVSFPSDCERLLAYWKRPCLNLAPDVEYYLDSIAAITGLPTYTDDSGTATVLHAIHELHRYQTGERVYYPEQEVKGACSAMNQGFSLANGNVDQGFYYIRGYYWYCFASQAALLCPNLDFITETRSPDHLVGLWTVDWCPEGLISAIINKRDDHCTIQLSDPDDELKKVFQITDNRGRDFYLMTSESYSNRSSVYLFERRDEELSLVVKTRIPIRKMRNSVSAANDPVVRYNPTSHQWDICDYDGEYWHKIDGTKSLYLHLDADTTYFEVH